MFVFVCLFCTFNLQIRIYVEYLRRHCVEILALNKKKIETKTHVITTLCDLSAGANEQN